MAADEYFDAIGMVLSYVLSAEDSIENQISHTNGKYFIINRDNTNLEFYAPPNNRYFILMYQFSLTNVLEIKYKENNQLLRGHIERYDLDDEQILDEDLDSVVSYNRIAEFNQNNVDEVEKTVDDVMSFSIHSDCRFERMTTSDPRNPEESEEIWDGLRAAGLLYPYEDGFNPRDYEQVAQEVISVGNQIDQTMEKLSVMDEVGFESL
ncbi:hypothetical protein ACKVMT_02180 [Halobacteriales archaeon Cl-PHB]